MAQILGVSTVTIYSRFARWEKNGLAGLRDQAGRGRKPILSIDDYEHIKRRVQENAQQLRVVRAQLKKELNWLFSEKTLRRYLKNLVVDIKDGASG